MCAVRERTWIPQSLGAVAFCGFLVLTACLGRLEWQDAYVAAFLDALRGCGSSPGTVWFTRNAAYLALVLVAVGVAIAFKRGARVSDVVQVLLLLVIALILVESIKLLLSRERPGGLSHLRASSFPSGHVANAAICVAAAVMLVRRRDARRDVIRGTIIVVGSLFVIAVAFTRVYFGLHWLTDVTASILIGVSFGGMLGAPAARQRLVGSWVLLVVTAMCLTAACGFGLTLPSPANLLSERLRVSPARHATFRLEHGIAPDLELGPWRADTKSLTSVRGDLGLRLESTDSERAILKLVADSSSVLSRHCGWMQLFVDGREQAQLRLEEGSRTYAFALPRLTGPHKMRLHLAPALPPLPSSGPRLILRALQIAYPFGTRPVS